MSETYKKIIETTRTQMEKVINHLEAELTKIRAGKANPQMLNGLFVEYYGTNTPLDQVANINTPDARTIVIQPWEKSMVQPIEKAIQAANIGLNPQNDGTLIHIAVPPLTEERRRDYVKKVKAEGEQGKISIRTLRREANEAIKKEVKNGLPEDIAKDSENKVQHLTDEFTAKIDKHLEAKEKEIMTV